MNVILIVNEQILIICKYHLDNKGHSMSQSDFHSVFVCVSLSQSTTSWLGLIQYDCVLIGQI